MLQSGAKGVVLLERVFQHLNLIEKDYFGLRFLDHTGQTVSTEFHSSTGIFSLLLPRFPKLPSHYYSHGPSNLCNLESNNEIEPDICEKKRKIL